MTDATDAYDARGNAPGPWWWSGKNLLLAADVLQARWLGAEEFLRAKPTERGLSIAVFGPTLLLRACALECLLKAMYLDRGNTLATGGKFKRPPIRDHDLVGLARLAELPSLSSVTRLLRKLERYISIGRYPIETSAERTYPMDDSGYAWSAVDEAEFCQLRAELFKNDDRLSVE